MDAVVTAILYSVVTAIVDAVVTAADETSGHVPGFAGALFSTCTLSGGGSDAAFDGRANRWRPALAVAFTTSAYLRSISRSASRNGDSGNGNGCSGGVGIGSHGGGSDCSGQLHCWSDDMSPSLGNSIPVSIRFWVMPTVCQCSMRA